MGFWSDYLNNYRFSKLTNKLWTTYIHKEIKRKSTYSVLPALGDDCCDSKGARALSSTFR